MKKPKVKKPRKQKVKKLAEKTQTPLEGLFGSMKQTSGPFDSSALKRVQAALFDGPLAERTEIHGQEFNAIVMLDILAKNHDCNTAQVILNAIARWRISLDRKGRLEFVTAIQSEIQRQLEEKKLEVERLRATIGERR